MSWRTKNDPGKAGFGDHYKAQPGSHENGKLPARAGRSPNNRVAGVRERNLITKAEQRSNREKLAAIQDPHEKAEFIRKGSKNAFEAGKISKAAYQNDLKIADKIEAKTAGKTFYIVDLHGLLRTEKGTSAEAVKHEVEEAGPENWKGGYSVFESKKDAIAQSEKNRVKTTLDLMRDRESMQSRDDDPKGRYNGYRNWDTWETMLIMDNTQSTSRNMDAWSKNFNRKIKAGRFDPGQAEAAVGKYIVPVARGKKKWPHYSGESPLTPDPEIDPQKVNKAEIVRMIIEREEH